MKWKIIIGSLLLAGVAVLCYKLGYRARVRDAIVIDARNWCISNLRLLDGAKQQWALENKKTPNDIPTWADLKRVLPKRMPEWPPCPSGGTYALRRVEETPICSIRGHELPGP